MSKLDEATQRLEIAVSALEARARARSEHPADGADATAFDSLKARNDALEVRNAEISRRLDKAIGQLRLILDD